MKNYRITYMFRGEGPSQQKGFKLINFISVSVRNNPQAICIRK